MPNGTPGGTLPDATQLNVSLHDPFLFKQSTNAIYVFERTSASSSLVRIDKATGAVATVAQDVAPQGLAAGRTRVYWTSTATTGSVRSIALTDTQPGVVRTDVAGSDVNAGAIFVDPIDGETVYFRDSRGIERLAPGGAPALLTNASATAFQADDTWLYWMVSAGGGEGGGVWRMPKAGGEVTQLAPSMSFIRLSAIQLQSDSLLVASGFSGAIWSLSPSNGSVTTLATPASVQEVVADAANLYWSDGAGVWRQPFGSNRPTEIFTPAANPDPSQPPNGAIWIDLTTNQLLIATNTVLSSRTK